jgi:hypothetical protein
MVVDTDGYDVLLGLDFLMKIGTVVDVERGLIQVRHGPGTNVEVLPLIVVNLLQRMSAGMMVRETSTTWKTHVPTKMVTQYLIRIERLSTRGTTRLPQIPMMTVIPVNTMIWNLID